MPLDLPPADAPVAVHADTDTDVRVDRALDLDADLQAAITSDVLDTDAHACTG